MKKPALILRAIFIVKKNPRWLSKIVHLGSEKHEVQLKKPPCVYIHIKLIFYRRDKDFGLDSLHS